MNLLNIHSEAHHIGILSIHLTSHNILVRAHLMKAKFMSVEIIETLVVVLDFQTNSYIWYEQIELELLNVHVRDFGE